MADDFPVPADKLRKLIKKSRQMPIPFGFNIGTTEENDEYLAAHPRKQPEMLGKIAKTEGAGTKAAYGTFAVDGSELFLTCFQTVPQLAKKFKKFLKAAKITLNVVVTDPEGNVVDSDVEVLNDWYRGDDEEDDDADDAAEAAAPAAPAQPGQPDPGIAERANRLRAIQGKLASLPPDIAARVSPALVRAAQLLREGTLDAVDDILRQLMAVLARVQLAAAQAAQKPATPVPEPTPQPQATPAADPRLGKLAEALKTLRDQVSALPEEATTAITALLDRAGQALDAAQADAALAVMREAQGALKAAQEAQAKWDKAFSMLEGPVAQALKGAAGDLKRMWDFAVNLAADGHWDRALATVPQIAAAVRAAATAPATATPEVPKDVVAFQRSRILWIGVRQKMLAEADALRDAIIAGSADDADRDDIAAAATEIATEVRKVDNRLQDILETITVTPEGAERTQLKRQAAGVIAEYQTLIGSGLFTVIDSNPFKPVSVASSARAALAQISRTLAA